MARDAEVFVAFGSNLGDRYAAIASARQAISRLPRTVLVDNAPIYETPPVGGPDGQDNYYNTVSRFATGLTPSAFLSGLQTIERDLGRDRSAGAVRWGPRTIDLDILLWDDERIDMPDLVVPHPRMTDRAFVLLPLADLDGERIHPVRNQTINELLERIRPDHEGIRRLPL